MLWHLITRQASFGWAQLRQVVLILYYGPGILVDRCKLFYHQFA
jgi:hypothetical protein